MSISITQYPAPFSPSGTYRRNIRHAAARPQPSLRLTPRGRFLAGGLVAVLMALGAVFFGSSVAATDEVDSVETVVVDVAQGDTLWGIAAAANPRGDVRATIDDIVFLNSLEIGTKLPLGAELAVPVYR